MVRDKNLDLKFRFRTGHENQGYFPSRKILLLSQEKSQVPSERDTIKSWYFEDSDIVYEPM